MRPQVFSAICVIFAHGAGEVGYMAGPLATIWDVYQNGALSKAVSPPVWVILIGASGLVVGLQPTATMSRVPWECSSRS